MPKANLSERVAQLEQQLASLHSNDDSIPRAMPKLSSTASHGTGHGSSNMSSDIPALVLAEEPSLSAPDESFPVLSLFDNDILTTDGKNGFGDTIYREFSTGSLKPPNIESSPHYQRSRMKRANVCEILTELLPSHAAMYEILEAGGFWWGFLRKMYPFMCSEDEKMGLRTFVFLALNQDNPAVIASALSWIVLGINCMSPDLEKEPVQLPIPAAELVERYVSDIDRLVVSDDELSISLEGIENMLLQCQFYSNAGRPRKSWTIIRRGLSHAVLLGLHRVVNLARTQSPQIRRRESIWCHLVECDSYLSLLLGLPSFMISMPEPEVGVINSSPTSSLQYRKILSAISGRISQRNHSTLSSLLSHSSDIDHDLDRLASIMPPRWWHLAATPENPATDLLDLHERIVAQFWYYQTKVYLHLPFMVQSPSDNRYDRNRLQCLAAAREMGRIYICMRELSGGRISLCRLIDFQSFTAAVILILGLLGYAPQSVLEDPNQTAKDWVLIYQIMDVLRDTSSEQENLTAMQALQCLQTLATIGRGRLSGDEGMFKRRIFVPYFGMISIHPGSKYATCLHTQSARQAGMESRERTEPAMASAQFGVGEPVIEIEAFNSAFLSSIASDQDGFAQPMASSGISFPDTLAMDIDQDWNWMLNQDYQM